MTKIDWIVIRADGSDEEHGSADWNADDFYTHVRRLFANKIGADINPEHVTVWFDGKYRDLFCDEIGAMTGQLRNERATKIYRANALERLPNPPHNPETLPAVYGDVILFQQKVWL